MANFLSSSKRISSLLDGGGGGSKDTTGDKPASGEVGKPRKRRKIIRDPMRRDKRPGSYFGGSKVVTAMEGERIG